MAEDKIMADGMFFKEKHQNAPDFVIGGLSIKIDQFTKFVKDHKDGDYLNFQVLKSKKGKPYIVLDTWKPNSKKENAQPVQETEYYNQIHANGDLQQGDDELPF